MCCSLDYRYIASFKILFPHQLRLDDEAALKESGIKQGSAVVVTFRCYGGTDALRLDAFHGLAIKSSSMRTKIKHRHAWYQLLVRCFMLGGVSNTHILNI